MGFVPTKRKDGGWFLLGMQASLLGEQPKNYHERLIFMGKK